MPDDREIPDFADVIKERDALRRENVVLEHKLGAAMSILWMAEQYAKASGARSVEMGEYNQAMAIVDANQGEE